MALIYIGERKGLRVERFHLRDVGWISSDTLDGTREVGLREESLKEGREGI